MADAKVAWIAVALSVAAFAGCLQGPDGPNGGPEVPGGGALDLDPLLDNETEPFGPLVRVNLTSETLGPITRTHASDPWIVDGDRVLNEYAEDGRSGIALSDIGPGNSTSYGGSFSASGDAEFPSADPAGENVYFSHVPGPEKPKVVRRPLEPGGNETVIADLRSQDIPQGPWAVSPDGSLIAGSVWFGGADGPQTRVIVLDVSEGDTAETVESVSGDAPRFVSETEIVFARGAEFEEGGLFVLEPASGKVSPLLRSSQAESLDRPTVAGDRIWFLARVSQPESNRGWEEIRHVSLNGDDPITVAWTEDYRIGPFDVLPSGEALVLDVYGGSGNP